MEFSLLYYVTSVTSVGSLLSGLLCFFRFLFLYAFLSVRSFLGKVASKEGKSLGSGQDDGGTF